MGNKRDKRQKFRGPRGKRSNSVPPQSNQTKRSKFRKKATRQHKNSWPPGGFGATSRLITDADKIGPSFSNARYRDMSERGKSLVLVERIKELFAIRDQGGVLEMEREASADTVKILADEIVNMWPKDWQPKQQERADDSGFRLLFWGPQIPNSVGNAITRASLYTNQILVVNPFTDSMLFHPNASPLVRPAEWISTYSMTALYIALLEPWIKAGIVELVQNPARFNASLMHKLKVGSPGTELEFAL